ncbi:MAG: hypothetical protein NZ742_08100 [Acidobacteria bacterium]|nr:hypothetical protein [Acidobacteriota bacterium]MDW7984824.1 hypothetical protein [Acidobacteriota bacterium]
MVSLHAHATVQAQTVLPAPWVEAFHVLRLWRQFLWTVSERRRRSAERIRVYILHPLYGGLLPKAVLTQPDVVRSAVIPRGARPKDSVAGLVQAQEGVPSVDHKKLLG